MKTHEEKFTAWVDGQLKGRELAEFEAALPHALDARLDKHAAQQIGELLRDHGRAPELANEDFFNHQVMQRIEAGSPRPEPAPVRRRFVWSLPRLAMAGAFSLLVAFGLYRAWIPGTPQSAAKAFEVINSDGKTKIYYSPENDVQVVLTYEPGLAASPAKRVLPKKDKDK